MLGSRALEALATRIRASKALSAKADISLAATRLGLDGSSAIAVGDDCAAIPEGDGWLLLAQEGLIDGFVESDPWFAGWCGVMVNVSDVAAMGGRPIAVVDAVWAKGEDSATPILDGLRAASERFGVPVVGGHTNLASDGRRLSVAILGRAKKLLTSFDAQPGDRLVAAIDLRGRYREPFANWEAATDAPAARLRGDIELLPQIAEAGLSKAAKDISNGGVVGTAAMFAECSGVAIEVDIDRVPAPEGVDPARWLMSFPSFGYLLAVSPGNVDAVVARFSERGIAAADCGVVKAGESVSIRSGEARETIWDFAIRPLIGARARALA